MASPAWSGPVGKPGKKVGRFREDIEAQMVIWRPILAKRVGIADVRRGDVSLADLARLNAMLDFEAAVMEAETKRP